MPFDNQPRLFKNGEVLRYCRSRDVELCRDLPSGQLAVAHESENRPSAGFGNRSECSFHGFI